MSTSFSVSAYSHMSSAFDNVSPMSVIIGRGRKIREHPGNQRFYALVRSCLEAYATAPTKTKKSLIILKILNDVRSACNNEANFVKLDTNTGEYYPVEESAARITIAQALRDSLNEHYKSSKQHKQRRRLIQKRATAFSAAAAKNTWNSSSNSSISSASSTTSSCTHTGNTNMMDAMSMNLNLNLNSVLQDIQPLAMARPTLALTRQVSNGSSNSAASSNNSAKMSSLRSILDQAVGISKNHHVAVTGTTQEQEETVMDDVFSSLFKAFGPSSNANVNPFEPTPIAEQQQTALFSDNASYGSIEQDWEPFPIRL
ncbi:Nitrilase family, member 2 [Seminavis robusta]|uniref:Nitrilase family, member 2 n=1 Tax=Seminavis robusta TaxID=568900 RepID=A0A9N8D5H0_9STRA|nr:Nitrilase family, member 2 [Seminavis robusta]|eukprot:Sro10_g007970.1 Nitrilase family, member 2 (314) ;mRNA; f:67109-68050